MRKVIYILYVLLIIPLVANSQNLVVDPFSKVLQDWTIKKYDRFLREEYRILIDLSLTTNNSKFSKESLKIDFNFMVNHHNGVFLIKHIRGKRAKQWKNCSKISFFLYAPHKYPNLCFTVVLRENDWADYEPDKWWVPDTKFANFVNFTGWKKITLNLKDFVLAGYSVDENNKLDIDQIKYVIFKMDVKPEDVILGRGYILIDNLTFE